VKGIEKGERLNRPNEMAVLHAIVRAGIGAAAREFGHRTGSCSRCGKGLDVNLTREIGMGEKCLESVYDRDARLGVLKDARESLRARGIDPAEKLDRLAAA
jgi:hypothetical protein